jgi:hypothetical protein
VSCPTHRPDSASQWTLRWFSLESVFRKFERTGAQFPLRLGGSPSKIRRQGLGNSMKCDSIYMRSPRFFFLYPLSFHSPWGNKAGAQAPVTLWQFSKRHNGMIHKNSDGNYIVPLEGVEQKTLVYGENTMMTKFVLMKGTGTISTMVMF